MTPFGLPEVEVAEPQLLVDQSEELHDLALTALLDLEVESAREVQRFQRRPSTDMERL